MRGREIRNGSEVRIIPSGARVSGLHRLARRTQLPPLHPLHPLSVAEPGGKRGVC